MRGRVVLISGANTGIGAVTARELARRGAHVVLACRSESRTQPVLDQIEADRRLDQGPGRADWLALDLADLDSVRRCAAAFLARDQPLHVLIHNAGVAGVRGLSASGFELAFGINHIGPFLLTQLLLPRLRESAPARVVTVASRAHRLVGGIAWAHLREPTRSWLTAREYGQSKLANVLFSAELGRRLQGSGVTTQALHPGVIASDLWRHVPAPLAWLLRTRGISTERGAQLTLRCASAEAAALGSGQYFSHDRVATPSRAARDPLLAATLWQRSADWVQADATA